MRDKWQQVTCTPLTAHTFNTKHTVTNRQEAVREVTRLVNIQFAAVVYVITNQEKGLG